VHGLFYAVKHEDKTDDNIFKQIGIKVSEVARMARNDMKKMLVIT